MKLNLEYKLPKGTDLSNEQLTVNYIETAISSANPQGLELQNRKIFSRIQRKLDEALESKKEVEFEKAELDLLVDSFRVAKFPPAASKYVVLLEQEIEKEANK